MTKYSPDGYLEDLPELITGRWGHACAGYHALGHFVLLVAGGTTNDGLFEGDSLSSTEIYIIGISSEWTEVSPLPCRLDSPRATTVNNVIYLTGEENDSGV